MTIVDPTKQLLTGIMHNSHQNSEKATNDWLLNGTLVEQWSWFVTQYVFETKHREARTTKVPINQPGGT